MKDSLYPYEWIKEAAKRIQPYINQTKLIYDSHNDLYLKCENRQITGSFKARGAINKVLSLQPWERDLGLVAASAGNHGQGVALAGKLFKNKVSIFCSANAAPNKIESMRLLGADVHLVPGGYGEAENAGLEYATKSSSIWISPYNDIQVIAGQGTICLETLRDAPDLDKASWIVPSSGGGLISGIGVCLKRSNPTTRLIAVQAASSPFMYTIYFNGNLDKVEDLPTLADGLSGPVQSGSLTIPLIRHYVDDFLLVSESEIEKAIAYAWWQYGEKIEGSAAAALAAVLGGKVTDRPAVIILSGGNIQNEQFQDILSRHQKMSTSGNVA